MNPVHVARILGAAIIASILGALVPAIHAARMHPVEALRWE
jgi:ABC-type antimicrobial peptide transport system permease subunit